MENKDVKSMRSMISLMESISEKISQKENKDELEEQGVTNVAKTGIETIGNILKTEKGLFSTLKNEIPALSKFKSAEELTAAISKGQVATADAYKIIKQANKIPEIAVKIRGFVGESPTFKEIVKKVFPKGRTFPPDPAKFKLASETLQRTYGMSAKEAEALLKGAEIEKGVSTGLKAGETGAKAGETSAINKASKGGEIDAKLMKEPASAGEAAMGMAEAEKSIKTPRAKEAWMKAKERLKKMKPKTYEKLKRIKKYLSVRRLLQYGLLTAGAFYLWDRLFGDGTTLPDFEPCVSDLVENNNGEFGVTSTGDPVVLVKTTGNQEYDSKGGLKFYTNKRVWAGDNSKKGTWSCGGSDQSKLQTAALAEASTSSTGIGNVNIVWDQEGGNTDNNNNNNKKQSKYRDCGREFPYAFGCKSEDISQLQKCLGIQPPVGNFGPITKKTLESIGYDLSNGITQEMFTDIKTNKCTGSLPEKVIKKGEPINVEPVIKSREPNLPTELKPMERPNVQQTSDSDQKYFEQIKSMTGDDGQPLLRKVLGRYKYYGPTLMSDQLNTLDSALSAKGFRRIKEKPKPNDNFKYVWVKK